jgi:single-strand DNA-binding protein
MAANFNRVILMGNLTRDPEIRYLPSGSAVADFGMAINRKYRTKDGQEGEETCFVDVSAWGRQGEVVAQYVSKGSPLFVEGRLKLDQWEKDGQKRSKLTVVAERVQLMSSPRGSGGEFQDNSAPATQGAPATMAPPVQVAPPVQAASSTTPDPIQQDDDNLPF